MSSTKKNSNKRVANDYYPTPGWCVDRLLEEVNISSVKWLEPAAGDGALIRAVAARLGTAPTWTAIELQDRFKTDLEAIVDSSRVHIGSFLDVPLVKEYDVIITNPPFSKALEFIKKSIELEPEYVCMLLRLNFMGSGERSDFLRKYTPDIYVVPNRPSFNGKGTDSIEYAWFVWQRKKKFGKSGTGLIKILKDTDVKIRKKKYYKSGSEAFEFSVLEYAEKQSLTEKEQLYLDVLEQNREKTYNLTFNASGPGNCLNEESRKKISQTLMGHKHSPETLKKLKEKSIYVNKKAMLKGPDGKIYNVDGIRNFSNQHNLDRQQIGRLINGKRTCYKGWVCIHKDS